MEPQLRRARRQREVGAAAVQVSAPGVGYVDTEVHQARQVRPVLLAAQRHGHDADRQETLAEHAPRPPQGAG